MKRWMLGVLVGTVITGCVQPIDDQLLRTDEEAQKAWKVTELVITKGLKGYEETEQSRATLEEKEIDRRLKDWLDRHTGQDGRLYASTQPGESTPLLREDILTIMKQREVLLLEAARNKERNLEMIGTLREAVMRYGVMIDMIADKKASILEKRKSAAAAFQAALNAVEGAGGGSVITALLLGL